MNLFNISIAIFVIIVTLAIFKIMKRHHPKKKNIDSNEISSSGSGERCAIYYATQTGTAKFFAEKLQKELISYFNNTNKSAIVQVFDIEEMKDFDSAFRSTLNYSINIFFAATYGAGEPPNSAIHFNKWLSRSRESNAFKDFKYCVFALGDSSYFDFCVFGKKIDSKFSSYGGVRVLPLQLGDDKYRIEDDFNTWKANSLYSTFLNLSEIDISSITTTGINDYESLFTYTVLDINDPNNKAKVDQANSSIISNGTRTVDPRYRSKLIEVISNNELLESKYDESFQSTKHIQFDISKSRLKYRAANTLGLFPPNSNELIEKVAKLLDVKSDWIISISRLPNRTKKTPLPHSLPIYIKDLLKWKCDLQGKLQPSIIKLLSAFATDKKESEILQTLASSKEEYSKIIDNRLNIVDLLEMYPSVKIPFVDFVDLIPKIKPRYYSISSSSKVSPTSLSLTVDIIKEILLDNNNKKKEFNGLCTSFLANALPGDTIPAFVRPSTFVLPKDLNVQPIIGIAAGCGIAPFKAWLDENNYALSNNNPVFEFHLIFGCRRAKEDCIYHEQLEDGLEKKTVSSYTVAFSREQEHKVYVQNKIEEKSEWILDLITKRHAYVYICGSKHMANCVRTSLSNIYSSSMNIGLQDAAQYFDNMIHEGRLIIEAW